MGGHLDVSELSAYDYTDGEKAQSIRMYILAGHYLPPARAIALGCNPYSLIDSYAFNGYTAEVIELCQLGKWVYVLDHYTDALWRFAYFRNARCRERHAG